jgi:hypothetical protein
MMPTQQDVINAFDSFNNDAVPHKALEDTLARAGFDISAVATAINTALDTGVLVLTPSGSIRKP